MSELAKLLVQKRSAVGLTRDDVFSAEESKDWGKRHPLGPVHFAFRCNACGELVLDDVRKPDLRDDNWKRLISHWQEKHGEELR